MKIADSIKKVLDLVPTIIPTILCKAADVNKGQLSAFLNKSGPMSDDKQADLVHFLLALLDETKVSADTSKKLAPLITQLKSFIPYCIKQQEASPYTHIWFGWDRYIERDIEQDIIAALERRPFVIGITSGPKTGKSSIAQRVRMIAAKFGNIIFLDCKHYAASGAADLVEWIFLTASTQLAQDFDEHPDSWESMVDWLKQDLLTSKTPVCTFIFDHVEALEDTYTELSSGWHYVLNQTRDEPALKGLCLVLAYDPASPVLYKANNSSSRLEQRARFFVPENYTKGQVDRLLKVVLAVEKGSTWNKQLTEDVWAMFQGHPFLTHVYAHAYGDSKQGEAANSADQAAKSAFHEHITPVLKAGVYGETLAAHFSAQTRADASAINEIKGTKEYSLLLHDSGLFFEHGFGESACLRCTPWVQARLKEGHIGADNGQ